MRPTDKEIEKEANSHGKLCGESEGVGFEIGAKWARNFDPWYYIEDNELPNLSRKVLVCLKDPETVMIACLEDDSYSERYYFEEIRECIPFALESVKCWMHIPEPKK